MSYVTVKNTESLCSSKSDQDAKTDRPCATTSLDEVTSSENMKQDVGEEMMRKGQDKDGDAPKAKEQGETEEEAMNAPTETSGLAGRDVTEEEERLAGNRSAGVEADGEEASAEEGPGSRSVTVVTENWIQCLSVETLSSNTRSRARPRFIFSFERLHSSSSPGASFKIRATKQPQGVQCDLVKVNWLQNAKRLDIFGFYCPDFSVYGEF